MKPVEVRPRQLPTPHTVHRRHVEGAPCFSQLLPVAMHAIQVADAPGFGRNTGAPIDGGAKDIECEGAHVAQVGHEASNNELNSSGAGGPSDAPSGCNRCAAASLDTSKRSQRSSPAARHENCSVTRPARPECSRYAWRLKSADGMSQSLARVC